MLWLSLAKGQVIGTTPRHVRFKRSMQLMQPNLEGKGSPGVNAHACLAKTVDW